MQAENGTEAWDPPVYDLGEGALRSVRWHIANYHNIRKAVYEKRLEMKRRSGAPERRSQGFVSDPTQTEALKNLTPLRMVTISGGEVQKPEAWIAAIDKVMSMLDHHDQRIIEVSFWEHHTWQASVDALHMDKMTYYRRRDKLMTLFAIECAARGLIRI